MSEFGAHEGSEEDRYVLSLGGGVNSTALLLLLINSGAPLDEVIFADTGGEVPETYAYLPRIQAFLDDHEVPFTFLSHRIHGRDLYETAWKRQVFPSALWRWSTRDFKVRPIHRYYRSIGGHINQYLGIAFDEIERMKDSRVESITNLYPLVDRRITRQGCVDIIEKAGWPVPVKSGCYFCPFNSLDRWQWLAATHPGLMEKSVALEENSKHFPSQRLTDQVFRGRATVTLRELESRLLAGGAIELEQIADACDAFCMT